MSNERRAMRWRVRFLVATTFAGASATIAVACGSDVPSDPPLCEGAACIDAGVDAPTPHDGASDTDAGSPDAFADAKLDAGETGADASDGSSCRYAEAGTDGGALMSAQRFGTTGHSAPVAVAVDSTNDDVVVVGSFFGQVDFGGGPLVSAGAIDGSTNDVFVAKRDKAGTHLWAKRFGSGILAVPTSVAVSSTHHTILGGAFFENAVLDFGCGPMTAIGAVDAFVVDFDQAGNCVWSKGFGAANETQNLLSVSSDFSGATVVAGISRGGASVGGAALNGPYLARFTAAGSHVWSKNVGATSPAGSPIHASGPQGEIFLAGTCSGQADLGDGAVDCGTSSQSYLIKLDSSGQHQWSRRYPAIPSVAGAYAGSSTSFRSLAVDSCGNAYIAGAFGGSTSTSIAFGDVRLTAPSMPNDAPRFLAKIDGTGAATWARMFTGKCTPTNANVEFRGLALNRAGGPILSADIGGDSALNAQTSVDFGGGTLRNADRGSAVIASFDATGQHQWSHVFGPPSTASSASGGIAAGARTVAQAIVFSRCRTTCASSPPNATIQIAGTTLTAVSGGDSALFSFSP